jgi:zeta-carotene desaturase
MPSVIVAGGGLAGLAATVALSGAGFDVHLFEARAFLGGRATSFPVTGGEDELIDNCQHILLRCCVNLLDFYRRMGVADRIRFYREFYFLEPGGRRSVMRRSAFSFARMRCLGWGDKWAILRGLLAIRRERSTRGDLDRISMADWLREKRQPSRAIENFWSQVLVSAVNEDLDRMAARHGFQVFWLGFLADAAGYEMGVPRVALRDLYDAAALRRMGNVHLETRCPVERLSADGVLVAGTLARADYYISAMPFERLSFVAPELGIEADRFEHSPITGIHIWYDRPVTDLPHATLLGRTLQWMFNKSEGRYLQYVVSASRSLLAMPRAEVIALARAEAQEFFPAAAQASIERAQVIKEVRATFSARPGSDELRPGARTPFPNLFLAGDWTRSGWPATMEGAVRSGYLAAEAVCTAAGSPRRFLLPEIDGTAGV